MSQLLGNRGHPRQEVTEWRGQWQSPKRQRESIGANQRKTLAMMVLGPLIFLSSRASKKAPQQSRFGFGIFSSCAMQFFEYGYFQPKGR
jgi:hypothetical protein